MSSVSFSSPSWQDKWPLQAWQRKWLVQQTSCAVIFELLGNLWSNLKTAFLLATERAFNEFQFLTKQTSDPQLVYKTFSSFGFSLLRHCIIHSNPEHLHSTVLWLQCVYTPDQVLVMFLWSADQSVWVVRAGNGASSVFKSLTICVHSFCYHATSSITCMLTGPNAWFHCLLIA